MTYKEKTLSQKNSPQKLLINWLNKKKFEFFIHDTKFNQLSDETNIYKDLKYVVKNSDTLVIFHNIPLYKNLKIPRHIKVILDPFSVLKNKNVKTKIINL